jgi:CDP-diacylglycerol---serine O-phosphatidyltransferase
VAALIFAIAAALRLARFNVMLDDPARPEWEKNFFTGIPAPAGALCALLPLYLFFLGLPLPSATAGFVLVYLVALALMMVSTIPTFSGKTLGQKVPRSFVLPVFVATVAFGALLISFPFEMLTLATLTYLGSLPLTFWHYQRLQRRQAQNKHPQKDPPR